MQSSRARVEVVYRYLVHASARRYSTAAHLLHARENAIPMPAALPPPPLPLKWARAECKWAGSVVVASPAWLERPHGAGGGGGGGGRSSSTTPPPPPFLLPSPHPFFTSRHHELHTRTDGRRAATQLCNRRSRGTRVRSHQKTPCHIKPPHTQ